MDDPARTGDRDVEQGGIIPVPTARQVLLRTLPPAALLAVGLPLITRWALNDSGDARGEWRMFAPAFLMGAALILQHLAQAPRPQIDQQADQAGLRRWLVFTSASGRVPEDPRTRISVGVLACGQLETAVLMMGAILGVIANWFVRSNSLWAATTILLLLIAVVPAVRARRGWRYLQALDAHERTG